MKENYEPPELFSEDISVTFVGACCPGTPETPGASFIDWCKLNCGPAQEPNYAPGG